MTETRGESRFEDSGEYYPEGLWWHWLSTSFASARGLKMLQRVEAVLLALPVPELYGGSLAYLTYDDDDEVTDGRGCVIGELWASCEVSKGGEPSRLAALESLDLVDENEYETAERGQECGLSYTMAWTLARWNDEACNACSDAQRYEHMLKRVRASIEARAPVAAVEGCEGR